jgi:hypothetical protein
MPAGLWLNGLVVGFKLQETIAARDRIEVMNYALLIIYPPPVYSGDLLTCVSGCGVRLRELKATRSLLWDFRRACRPCGDLCQIADFSRSER